MSKIKGFTLVELLVVIAIIAILAAILFPVFAQAKLAAKKAADLSNATQLGIATMIYIDDFDDTYPMCVYDTQSMALVPGSLDHVAVVYDELMPYMKNTGILQSPVNMPGIDFGGAPPDPSVLTSVGLLGLGNFKYASYAPNFALFEDPALQMGELGQVVAPVVNASGVPEPADTVGFYTGKYVGPTVPAPAGLSPFCAANWPNSPLSVFGTYNFPADTTLMNGTNASWADGHAKFIQATAGLTQTSTTGCEGAAAPCLTYHMPCDLTGIPGGSGSTWGN